MIMEKSWLESFASGVFPRNLLSPHPPHLPPSSIQLWLFSPVSIFTFELFRASFHSP